MYGLPAVSNMLLEIGGSEFGLSFSCWYMGTEIGGPAITCDRPHIQHPGGEAPGPSWTGCMGWRTWAGLWFFLQLSSGAQRPKEEANTEPAAGTEALGPF